MKGRVYEIVCNITGKRYIGSTTLSLSRRMSKHEWDYNNRHENTHVTASCEILKNKDYESNVLREYDIENRRELEKYEQKFIDKLECINKKRAFNSHEYNNEQRRLHRKNNPELYKQQWLNKMQDDDFREKHRVRAKAFYHENREIIREKRAIVHKCPCGGKYTANHKARHETSLQHHRYLEDLPEFMYV